jgi:hypothetical protein
LLVRVDDDTVAISDRARMARFCRYLGAQQGIAADYEALPGAEEIDEISREEADAFSEIEDRLNARF